MSTSTLPLAPAAKLPAGASAAQAWDEICRGLGVDPLPAPEMENLTPWNDQEADAFERTIQEAFEQVESSPRRA